MTRILMVAADAMEFPGILRHTSGAAPGGVGIDWSRRARLGNYELLLAANGMGARRAAAAVDAALAGFRAEAIVSTGFCGALEGDLEIADIVTGTAVSAEGRSLSGVVPGERAAPSTGNDMFGGSRCADRGGEGAVACGRRRARWRWRPGAWRNAPAAHGVPFYCVRVVTDLADEDMANNFNEALRPDGHFATINILRGALRNPLVRVPELIRLRNRCVRAAGALGDFIADCRF